MNKGLIDIWSSRGDNVKLPAHFPSLVDLLDPKRSQQKSEDDYEETKTINNTTILL